MLYLQAHHPKPTSNLFIFLLSFLLVIKALPRRKPSPEKWKSPSLTQRKASRSDQRNPPGRRKRKRRSMRGKSKGRRGARAAATTTVLTKWRRSGRRAKVDTKPINIQEPGSEMKGAARRTVMMKSGRPAVTRSGSRTPAETQTLAWVWRRRGGQTGKQRARKVRTALLETKLSRRDAAGRKTTSFASVPLHIITRLLSAGQSESDFKPELRKCRWWFAWASSSTSIKAQSRIAVQDVGRSSWTGALLAAHAIISSVTFIFPGCVREAETNAVVFLFFLKLLYYIFI